MTRSTTFLSLLLSFAGVGACSQPAATEGQQTLGTAPAGGTHVGSANPMRAEQQTTSTSEVMREHAGEAREMRNAIIAGQLAGARHAGSQIARDEWTPSLRLNYLLYVSAVRSAARTVQASTSLSDAALALGEMGETCAACHRSASGPPALTAAAAGDKSTLGMPAHAAAEQALWDGLVTPSDASWSRGARELLEAPELDSGHEQASLLARRTRDLAREAATATNTRGDVYGRIVATCAGCHLQVKLTQ